MAIDFKVTAVVVVVGLGLFAGGYYLGTTQSSTPAPAAATAGQNQKPEVPEEIANKTCFDFETQAIAQSFFDSVRGDIDPKRMDGDGDGIACEKLP